MKILKRKKKAKRAPRDAKKDAIFRELAKVLHDAGCEVRREKLKQGSGWRVMSGACKANEQSLIFVDSRLDQDEQITFLVTRIVQLGVEATEEQLENIPERVRKQILSAKAEKLDSAA
jgi:hypothetical protein